MLLANEDNSLFLFMLDKCLIAGAIGAVTGIENPVQLSKKVMEQTPHCLLVGEGACKFARKIGHPVLEDPKKLISQDSILKMSLDSSVKYEHAVKAHFNDIVRSKDLQELEQKARDIAKNENIEAGKGSVAHDTVGAVALDSNGNFACATSTGKSNVFVKFFCIIDRWPGEFSIMRRSIRYSLITLKYGR